MKHNFHIRKDILFGIFGNGTANINGFCYCISYTNRYTQAELKKEHLTQHKSFGAPQQCGDST